MKRIKHKAKVREEDLIKYAEFTINDFFNNFLWNVITTG